MNAKKRDVLGKKVKNLRLQGEIPGVVYGHEVSATPVSVGYNEFDKVWRHAGGNTLVKLNIDGETKNILIHEPVLDPIKSTYQHIDFYAVKMSEKIRAEVPIHFEGESPAVKDLDGTLMTNKTALEVECLPADLPHNLVADLSTLATFEDSIRVSDIRVPANVTILAEPEDVIAIVNPPRSEEEIAALNETVEENVETVEVEEKGKVEEEAVEGEEVPAAEIPPPPAPPTEKTKE